MKKILVIDDEEDILEGVTSILSMEGYEAIGASDGETGYQMAMKHIPDLILCDFKMPDLNGNELLSKLRSNSLTVAIQFIFMTAKIDIKERVPPEFREDIGYLFKPFEISKLLDTVSKKIE